MFKRYRVICGACGGGVPVLSFLPQGYDIQVIYKAFWQTKAFELTPGKKGMNKQGGGKHLSREM